MNHFLVPWFSTLRRRMRYRLGFVRRKSALALVDEANRWEKAYRRERDDAYRALHLAEHLFQMIPRQVWRDSGGGDGQGHYEGEYRAESVRDELVALRTAHSQPEARA